MLPGKAIFSILFFLLGLSACDQSTPPDSDGRDRQAKFVGTYNLEGDKVFFHSPPTTASSCIGDYLEIQIVPGRTDTSTVQFSGNRLTVLQKPETFRGDSGEAVIQRYTENTRVSGRSGIQGIWKASARGYSVISGTLNQAIKEYLVHRMLLGNESYQYLSFHDEFTDDTVWSWTEGNFAGYFLADWNGELPSQSDDTSTSERYDVQVRIVDPRKVELKGLKTGETVTITFEAPRGSHRYSSDQPGRISYRSGDMRCPIDLDWYLQFLETNRKEHVLQKQAPAVGAL